MVGLLNTSNLSGPKRGQTASYSTPQAATLLGAGNSSITDDQIRAFIAANKNDPNKILRTALDNGVSINQYANAAGIDPSQARSFVESQGINLNQLKSNTSLLNNSNRTTQGSIATNTSVPNNPFGGKVEVPAVAPQPVPEPEKVSLPDRVSYNDVAPPPAVTYNPAAISTTRLNPKTDTVQGQLNTILQDPDSPLMVAARTRGEQYANRRGLLNSSLGAEAGNKAMIDSALNIATPDAATNANTALQNTAALNQGNQFNAQQGLLASQTNADNLMRTNMFNADTGLRAGMYNADNQFKTNAYNSDSLLRRDMFNSDLNSKIGMFNTGTAADILKNRESLSTNILNNRESLASNFDIANLDTDTKLAVADLQARSEDSKYAASLYDTLLKIQESINTNPDIPSDDKARYFSDAAKIVTNGINLLDTFENVDIGDFNFGEAENNGSLDNGRAQSGQQATQEGKSIADPSVSLIPDGTAKTIKNVTGYTIPADRVKSIQNYNAKYGKSYDPGKLVALDELEGMTPEQRFAKFDPLPLYDREGNLKLDAPLFHRV